jgi:hypothetical protein
MPRRTTDQAQDDAVAEAIAKLPRDVRAGLDTLSPEDQRAYLDSLKAGKTIEPPRRDPAAPWGRRRDGQPKARPGRKATRPGARTLERPERFKRDDVDMDQLLAELPDDDDSPIPIPEGYPSHHGDPHGEPAATNEERQDPHTADAASNAADAASNADAYAEELRAALESGGIALSGREVVSSREVMGKRRIDVPEDDPLAIPTVEEVGPYRVTAGDTDWFLEQLVDDQWQVVSQSLDVSGLACYFSRRSIVIEGFGEAIKGLPRYRSRHQARLDKYALPPKPMSVEDKRRAREGLASEMAAQRRRHDASGDRGKHSWID